MTPPKKRKPRTTPRPRTRRDPAEALKTITDATKAKLPVPLRVTPPPVGVPCVDYPSTGTFTPTTRIAVTAAPPSPLRRAHALMLRLSDAWDRLAARLA